MGIAELTRNAAHVLPEGGLEKKPGADTPHGKILMHSQNA